MRPADFYTGIVPAVYAALRSTHFDAERYVEFVRDAGQPALELGCGDDGPFLELIRQGFDVEGVDSSPDMLDRCRARAAAEGLQAVMYCQPMEELRLPRLYRAIYLAGPTFTLLTDDDTASRTLAGIASHLDVGGQAMVPLWIPDPTPEQHLGHARVATTAEGATVRYTIESEEYDEARRIRRTSTHYELLDGARTESVRRDWIVHWHMPSDFTELCRAAGLTVARLDPVEDGEYTAFVQRAK